MGANQIQEAIPGSIVETGRIPDAVIVKFEERYKDIILVNTDLSRGLVSYQNSKNNPIDRWYKYREGFSPKLVKYYLDRFKIPKGKLIDPFLGSGTSVLEGAALGYVSHGIELLPIGKAVAETRIEAYMTARPETVSYLKDIIDNKPWSRSEPILLNEIGITNMAYSPENRGMIERYLGFLETVPQRYYQFCRLAVLAILEDISFTRKDGQYLRWDSRSGKTKGSFNKGVIKTFDLAIIEKLREIYEDLGGEPDGLFSNQVIDMPILHDARVISGSSLKVMGTLPSLEYEVVFTSPPYANRYDYTRTYALELALLGASENEVKFLRQEMLSCTVENKKKDLVSLNPDWLNILNFVREHELFKSILNNLTSLDVKGELNNSEIIKMLENYILEMACVIFESYRILKNKGYMFMVNDNVRYAGYSIPIDIMLSEIACQIGFDIVSIDVLPGSKGNSSQQMGDHGQDRLRKCVYIWRKKCI